MNVSLHGTLAIAWLLHSAPAPDADTEAERSAAKLPLAQEPAPARAPMLEPAPTPGPPRLPTRERPRARWLGGLGITGIVLATGGVATVAVGTVFIDRGVQRELDPRNHEQYLVRDYQREGWLLYGAGLAGVAVGGLMLALDVTELHERRLSRLAVRPTFDPSHAGLMLRGRF